MTLALISFESKGQDYINIAVVECCDCFTQSHSSNKDSLMTACSMGAINRNFEGLVSDLGLTGMQESNARQVLPQRMVKYYSKCKPVKKYLDSQNSHSNRAKD